MSTYQHTKPAQIAWLGDVPKHWEISKLGQILKPFSEKNHADLPLLSITRELGVIERDIENQDENHNFIPDDLSGYKLLKKGQFGMNKMKAWQGSYGVSPFTGIVSPAYFIFDFVKEINPDFFHWAIRSKLYVSFFGSASDGVRIGQWDLSKSRMKNIPFVIPPLPEQTAIAEFLDKKTAQIQKAIALKTEQIARLKEYRQTLINQTVTQGLNPNATLKNSGVAWLGDVPSHWEIKKLKFVTDINLQSLPENTSKTTIIQYVDIGSVSFENGIEKVEQFTFENAPSRARRTAKVGDTIVSTVRTYLKAISIISNEFKDCVFSTGFAVLSPKIGIDNKYLANFLKSDAFTNQVTINSKGMSYPAINSTDLSNLWVALPPLPEQTAIAEFLDKKTAQIDTALANHQTQIERLKEYQQSLINDVVTGKISVQAV